MARLNTDAAAEYRSTGQALDDAGPHSAFAAVSSASVFLNLEAGFGVASPRLSSMTALGRWRAAHDMHRYHDRLMMTTDAVPGAISDAGVQRVI